MRKENMFLFIPVVMLTNYLMILIDIGVDCFNPFQPEVMDVIGLMKKYRIN